MSEGKIKKSSKKKDKNDGENEETKDDENDIAYEKIPTTNSNLKESNVLF